MKELYEMAQRRAMVANWLYLITAVLLVVSLGLQLVHNDTTHNYVFGLVRVFNVDAEANVPTLFSTLLLIAAGLLLWVVSKEEKARGGIDAGRWKVLAIVFLYLAVDEAASLHELFIPPGGELLGKDRPGIFFYAWVIPYGALVIGLGLYFLGFFFRLPMATRVRFFLAAVLYVGGALGFEMIEGVEDQMYGHKNDVYAVMATIEEGMEMLGVVIFIHAIMEYLAVTLNKEAKAPAALAISDAEKVPG